MTPTAELRRIIELGERATAGLWSVEGPDDFGDYNITHPTDALAVAAVVSNMRPADEVAANADLVGLASILPNIARELIQAREALAECIPVLELRVLELESAHEQALPHRPKSESRLIQKAKQRLAAVRALLPQPTAAQEATNE